MLHAWKLPFWCANQLRRQLVIDKFHQKRKRAANVKQDDDQILDGTSNVLGLHATKWHMHLYLHSCCQARQIVYLPAGVWVPFPYRRSHCAHTPVFWCTHRIGNVFTAEFFLWLFVHTPDLTYVRTPCINASRLKCMTGMFLFGAYV